MSGLISVFVYCFMVAWNDYLFASIFLSSASNFTLPVGLNALFSTPDYIWGRMMAASLVTALPVVIMYALSERFIKSGLTAGGMKELKRPISLQGVLHEKVSSHSTACSCAG